MILIIPIILFFIQICIAFFCFYFLGYFPWNLIIQNFWTNYINIFLPIIIIGGTSLSFFVKNPVWALLLILFSFLMLGILLINIGLEFITYFFIIVYLGALMMSFLFVIMLFNLQQLNKNQSNKKIKNISIILSLYLISYNITTLNLKNITTINISPLQALFMNEIIDFNTIYYFTNTFLNNYLIFKSLYTNNSIYFIIITLILLYALIGALTVIALVQKTKDV